MAALLKDELPGVPSPRVLAVTSRMRSVLVATKHWLLMSQATAFFSWAKWLSRRSCRESDLCLAKRMATRRAAAAMRQYLTQWRDRSIRPRMSFATRRSSGLKGMLDDAQLRLQCAQAGLRESNSPRQPPRELTTSATSPPEAEALESLQVDAEARMAQAQARAEARANDEAQRAYEAEARVEEARAAVAMLRADVQERVAAAEEEAAVARAKLSELKSSPSAKALHAEHRAAIDALKEAHEEELRRCRADAIASTIAETCPPLHSRGWERLRLVGRPSSRPVGPQKQLADVFMQGVEEMAQRKQSHRLSPPLLTSSSTGGSTTTSTSTRSSVRIWHV